MKITCSKEFVVNMGQYESQRIGMSVELSADDLTEEYGAVEALAKASRLVDEAAYADLTEAAATTDVRNSYILTWLHNRKDEPYAKGNH